MKGRSLLILDRDGTLIVEKHYLSDPAQVELLPGVVEGLRCFRQLDYDLAVITNQSGIGRGYFDEKVVEAVHARLLELLAAEGISLDEIFYCPHHPDDACACRKPATGLLDDAFSQTGHTAENCLVVGDKGCDIELGRRSGTRTALVRTGYGKETEARGLCTPDFVVDGLVDLAREAQDTQEARDAQEELLA